MKPQTLSNNAFDSEDLMPCGNGILFTKEHKSRNGIETIPSLYCVKNCTFNESSQLIQGKAEIIGRSEYEKCADTEYGYCWKE